MSAEFLQEEKHERPPVSASISVLLKYDSKTNGLLLVRNGNQWGLPAGGLETGEFLFAGIRRELGEETGLSEDKIIFERQGLGIYSYTIEPSFTICIPGVKKTRIGLIYNATYYGPRLPREGWPMHEKKVNFAKPFTTNQILALLENHVSTNTQIYKPEMNFPVLMRYLIEYAFRRYPAYFEKWLSRMEGKIQGLNNDYHHYYGNKWSYIVPYFSGQQNFEAVKRKNGLKWGP